MAEPANNNTNQQTQAQGQQQDPTQNQQGQAPAIDYDKIQQMLNGTLAAKEDTALKAYFKQQGLSQQEVEQAISAFKQQKAANQPDIAGLQSQIAQGQTQVAAAQKAALQAQVDAAATMAAVSLGIDAKTIPYVLKMADLSAVVGQDGQISQEALTAALNKVLEDVPQLKPAAGDAHGFTQIGTGGNPAQQAQSGGGNTMTVPTKKWNRFNNR